jgi:putative ABC transport system permease protein
MLAFRLLWRDWRGGELGVLLLALIAAVAIVVGIASFTERLQRAIVAESSDFLAADRVLQTATAANPAWLQEANSLKLEQATTIIFQSMVVAGENMKLASVKAVSNSYPLRGKLVKADLPFAPGVAVEQGPARGEVWLDSRMFPLMNLQPGDMLEVGQTRLKVVAAIVTEPDRADTFFSFGPRVLMNLADVTSTGIIQPGSRVDYRYLFAGDAVVLEDFGAWLKTRLTPSQRWLGLGDNQPRISSALNRAQSFLLLAGGLGVALAGIAVALAARRYSERHYDYVAILKSLGASSGRILRIYLSLLIAIALLAIVVGSVLGYGVQYLFLTILGGLLVGDVPAASMRPLIIGAATSLVCLLTFAIPPLLALRRISPLRVLRADIGVSRMVWFDAALGIAGVVGLMWWYSQDLRLTLTVLLGVLLTIGIGSLMTLVLVRWGGLLGMQAGSVWRLAMAAIRRRANANAVQVVIFALSLMMLLVLVLVRSSLVEEWQGQLPEGTPNHFLTNVSATEVNQVVESLEKANLKTDAFYAMVRGRLVVIDDKVVNQAVTKEEVRDPVLDRELNLTWSDVQPDHNPLTSGTWWKQGSDEALVSVETKLAKRLGITIGQKLTFQIGGDRVEATVANLRTVDWDSLKPNFYMVFPEKLLSKFPATYITAFYLPPNQKTYLNDFYRQYPTVTVLEMDAVITQIRGIIQQVSLAIEVVLVLIVCCGLLVLVASLGASLDLRLRENAILRTLGASKKLIMGGLVIEFVLLGLLAGLLAAMAAEIAVYVFQTWLLDMTFAPHYWVWVLGPIAGAILIGGAGYFACRRVVLAPPIAVLRQL